MSEAYKNAGVDVHAGYEAVRRIKPLAERTHIPGVLAGLGGFGGCFELPKGYNEPVLVSGTDGVGTKLKLAFMTGKHNTIGIDAVAMCVNDIVCQGAKPLYFLDYIATSKIDPSIIEAIIEGVSEGCVRSGCALIGGETAEMAGMYQDGEYDIAGFAVGIAEKSKVITGERAESGDVLIGVASSGVHSNGFALIRKIVFEEQKLTADSYIPELGKTIGEELLTPTKLYARLLGTLTERFDIRGAANITGGGWIENIPRLLGNNESVHLVMSTGAVPVPPVFTLLQKWGGISNRDMYNTFNMGVGLVLAVPARQANDVILAAVALGEKAYIAGSVEAGTGGEPLMIKYE
jgi:phosphoribosylformylglycinamidine cyclo-ligase